MKVNGNTWTPELWATKVLELVLQDEAVATTPIDYADLFQYSEDVVEVQGQSVVMDTLVCHDDFVPVADLKGNHPEWLRETYLEPAAAELIGSIRHLIYKATYKMPAGHHAVLVCRPWAPDVAPPLGAGRFTVSKGGLSLTLHTNYDSDAKAILLSFDILAKVIVVPDEPVVEIEDDEVAVRVEGVRADIYLEIEDERSYQDGRWGTEFDDKNTANDWVTYITHYATKAAPLTLDVENFEAQMVKVAALAVAAIETSRRNGGPAARHYDGLKK